MTDHIDLQDDPEFDPSAYSWPYERTKDGIKLYATEELSDQESGAYIRRCRAIHPKCKVYAVIDGDSVDLHYQWGAVKFDRIRRITGYLVGTLDRFNDGKRAEEAERVKHSL